MMTPVPPRVEEPTVNTEEADCDLAQYEREGWTVGFDVEFHGTGTAVIAVDGSDSSFSSDDEEGDDREDSVGSEDDDRYSGYQRVPMSMCVESETEKEENEERISIEESNIEAQIVSGYVPPKIQSEFEKLMMSPSVQNHEKHDYVANDIPLDAEKTDQIKKAMAGFSLEHNEQIKTKDLLNLVQKMVQEKS